MVVLASATLCLLGILVAFLLAVRGPLRAANRLLAGFLLLTAIDLAGWLSPLLPAFWRELIVLRLPLAFLQMPFLYAYVAMLCFPQRRSGGTIAIGAAQAFASFASLLPRALDVTIGADPAFTFDTTVNGVALHVQFYAYAALMVAVLVRHRRAVRHHRASKPSLTVPWVTALLTVSLLAHTLVLVKSLAWMNGLDAAYDLLQRAVALVALAVTVALTLVSLLCQSLFVGVPGRKAVGSPAIAERPQPPDPSVEAVRRFMDMHEPFLDPGLTIRSLARRVGMTQRDLSILINDRAGMHFFDFVNGYRIERAAALLADPAHRADTILAIAHQAGFNTKSSFNAAFVKLQGEAPSRYRARVQAASAPHGASEIA